MRCRTLLAEAPCRAAPQHALEPGQRRGVAQHLEPPAGVVVLLGDHAHRLVDLADQALLGVRHQELAGDHGGLEEGDDDLAQRRDVVGVFGGDQDRARELSREGGARLGVDPVDLVEEEAAGHGLRADLAEHGAGHLELAAEGGVGRVGQVEEERRLERLVEGAAERGHQVVGELLDEAHGVGDQDARLGLGVERAHRRVEGGEELVRHQHRAAGEGPHQRRFAGVGVTDQRHAAGVLAVGAAHALLLLDGGELLAQLGDAVADLALVELQRRLARALAPDAPALPVGAPSALAEARSDVGEARDLHLELGLATLGVAVENLHDHARAVQHRRPRGALQVARLARRDLVIDHHQRRRAGRRGAGGGGVGVALVPLVVLAVFGGRATGARLVLPGRSGRRDDPGPAREHRQLGQLALADHGGGGERAASLRHRGDHVVAEGVHEATELRDGGGVIRVVDAGELNGDEHGGGAFRGGVRHAVGLAA